MMRSKRSNFFDLKVGSINKLSSSGHGIDDLMNEERKPSNYSKTHRSSQLDSLKPDDDDE
jgi:hypothetical protein